jgi:CRP-like cAMP-binding protein
MTVTDTEPGTDANVFEQLIDRDALRITLSEGEIVCAEGDDPDAWWYVVDGYADVTRDGRYLATIGPDETIGEISMLDGRARTATVTAVSEMTLLVGSAEELLAALEASPALALAMARQVACRFRDLSEQGSRPPVSSVDGRDLPSVSPDPL